MKYICLVIILLCYSCGDDKSKIYSLMDKYEVTVKDYKKCVAAGKCSSGSHFSNSRCNYIVIGREEYPMNCVFYEEAEEYCNWKGKKLPSEEEWEIAATAEESYKYSGSNNADEVAWYSLNSENTTHKVGTKKPNNYGIYDMSGNVWEWVTNPCSITNDCHYIRGGSSYSVDVKISVREYDNRNYIFYDAIGFRCIDIH